MACRTSTVKDKVTGRLQAGDSQAGQEDRCAPVSATACAADANTDSSFDIYNAAEALSQLRGNGSLGANGRSRRRGRPRRTFRSPTPYGPTGPNLRWKRFEAAPGLRLELTRTDLESSANTEARCPLPCCGRTFGSRQALAAHLRHFPSHRVFYNENIGHRYGNSRVRIRYITAAENSSSQEKITALSPSRDRFACEYDSSHSDALHKSQIGRSVGRAAVPARVLGNLTNIADRRADSDKGQRFPANGLEDCARSECGRK
jgi:hypothetical protein